MKQYNFSEEQVNLLCTVLNQYGDEDAGVYASDATLNFFQLDYVKRIIRRAIRHTDSSFSAHDKVKELLAILNKDK